MAKIQIKNSFITSSADITISSSLVRFSGGISAKNITGSFSGSIPQLSSYFKQGGNSFGTTATLGTNDNQALIFETNGSEKMRIIPTGEIGIGTTAAFSTGGTAQLSVATNVNAVALSIGASNNDMSYIRRLSAGVYQWQTISSGANDGQIHLQPYGGNVGIGTSSPLAKLHVVGPVIAAYAII